LGTVAWGYSLSTVSTGTLTFDVAVFGRFLGGERGEDYGQPVEFRVEQ
jgi:hypothetical protein